MRTKWIALICLAMCLLFSVQIAYAAENSATATIDLVFDGITFTDTVQVEWKERYGKLDELRLWEDEFYSYEEEQLLFSVRCDSKNARIELYDETDTFISIMFDDGTHGDITANDGVYSCSYSIKTDEVSRISYYAVSGNSRSNDVTAYFYSAPSSNYYEQYEDIIAAIKRIEQPYTDENGFVLDTDNAKQAFSAVLEYLTEEYNKYSIIKLDVTERAIEFTLPYGLQIIYEPTFEDCLLQGSSTDPIITVLTANEFSLGTFYRDKLKAAATDMDAALENYEYDDDNGMYDIQDGDGVTLFTVRSRLLRSNSVILWVGHGGRISTGGCAIGTTEKFTNETINKYSDLSIVKNREYVLSKKGIIFFTPAFVRNKCNLTGSFVYFQCCVSAERGTDDSMVEACIDAGADVYAGNIGETEQAYAYGFLYDVIKRMTEVNPSNGKLYTLGEAQQYAYDMPYWDFFGSIYYASNPNYRFKENQLLPPPTHTSILSCTVVDQNTQLPLNATVTLIPQNTSDESAIIQVQGIGNTGILEMELDAGNYELRVSMDGYLSHTETITVTRDSTINLNVSLEPTDAPQITKGTLNGAVTFNSAGVNGIEVNVLNGTNHVVTLITNEAGQFAVDLEPGAYTLSIDAEGYVPVSKNTTVFVGKTTTENIELDDSMYATVEMRIIDYLNHYIINIHNAKNSVEQIDFKLTLVNGTILYDTAQGIINDSWRIEDEIVFILDDELIQGSELVVTATDGTGRRYEGSIMLGAGWQDGRTAILVAR